MPKTKNSKPKSKKLNWKRLFIYFTPVIIVAILVLNYASGGAVLGVTDSNLINKTREKAATTSGENCIKGRVTSFSASGACDSNKNGFKTFSYTCEDGKTGSVTSAICANIQSAYEKALRSCSKGKCGNSIEKQKQNSISPKPTRIERSKTESGL